MTKKMLVKTESVDMTWGRVLGSDGWGEGELVQRNRCERIFPSKTEKPCFFSQMKLPSNFLTHRHSQTHTQARKHPNIPSCDFSEERQELLSRNLWAIPGFLNYFLSLSPENISVATSGTLFVQSSRNRIKSHGFESCWKLGYTFFDTLRSLPVWQHDTLLNFLPCPSEISHPHVSIKCWIGKPCRRRQGFRVYPLDLIHTELINSGWNLL